MLKDNWRWKDKSGIVGLFINYLELGLILYSYAKMFVRKRISFQTSLETSMVLYVGSGYMMCWAEKGRGHSGIGGIGFSDCWDWGRGTHLWLAGWQLSGSLCGKESVGGHLAAPNNVPGMWSLQVWKLWNGIFFKGFFPRVCRGPLTILLRSRKILERTLKEMPCAYFFNDYLLLV